MANSSRGNRADDANRYVKDLLSLKMKLQTLETETIFPLKSENSLLRSENDVLSAENIVLKSNEEQLIKENNVLRTHLTEVRGLKEKHSRDAVELEKRLKIKQANYEEMVQKMVSTTESNAAIYNEMKKLQEELNRMKNVNTENRGLREERNILIKEIKQLKDGENVSKSLIEKLQDERSVLNKKIQGITVSFNEFQKLVADHQDTITKLKAKNVKILHAYKVSKIECQRLTKKLDGLAGEKCKPDPACQELFPFGGDETNEKLFQVQPGDIMKCVKDLTEREIDSCVKEMIEEFRLRANELITLRNEKKSMQQKMVEKENQFAEVVKEAETRIARLSEAVKKSQVSGQKMIEKENQFAEIIKKAEMRIVRLNEVIKKLSGDIEFYKEQMQIIKNKTQEKMIEKEIELELSYEGRFSGMETAYNSKKRKIDEFQNDDVFPTRTLHVLPQERNRPLNQNVEVNNNNPSKSSCTTYNLRGTRFNAPTSTYPSGTPFSTPTSSTSTYSEIPTPSPCTSFVTRSVFRQITTVEKNTPNGIITNATYLDQHRESVTVPIKNESPNLTNSFNDMYACAIRRNDFLCFLCDKQCVSKNSFQKHMRKWHWKNKIHCDSRYKWQRNTYQNNTI